MEDLEKKAKLAELIKCTSLKIRCLISMAQNCDYCLNNIPTWDAIKHSPSEDAVSSYLYDIRDFVRYIEDGFSDIHNFIEDNY